MNIPFYKMHGASNDFIVVDDRQRIFPEDDPDWITQICSRRTGVGSEGVLLIQPSDSAHFRMRFFNPDGGEVDMCGNGARCIARLASEIGAAPRDMRFDTAAGVIAAQVGDPLVTLQLYPPKDWRMNQRLGLNGASRDYHFVNSGVPHVVMIVDEVANVDVQALGAAIRHHADFAPGGTNANFISVTGPDSIRIRTYERGVEAETLACGTGILAGALIAGRLGLVTAPVRVHSRSGDELIVNFQSTDAGADRVTLTGPAVHVFQGVLDYERA